MRLGAIAAEWGGETVMGAEAHLDPGWTHDPVAALLGNWFAGARKRVGRSIS